jgi:hypothetical protein
MSIRITSADREFSKCVREAAGWMCQKCGAQHQEKSMGLHNAHFMSRGNWGTRFDPDNTAALCYGCHSHLDSHPYEKTAWFEKLLGEELAQIVREKAKRPAYGIKKHKADIAKHYRQELKRLHELRNEGATGPLKVIGYF